MARFTGNRLVLASHNAGKLEEITRLLEPFRIEVTSVAALGLPEPEETEDSFIGNALIKARAATAATGLPALADDSGLEVDALDGAPGVRTADWAETPAGRDFGLAMRRTHAAVLATGASPPWTARFCCTLALAWPNGESVTYQGFASGALVWPPRGDQGHGYDPMFQPEGYDITFGEMDRWRKNEISHRADAFRQLVEGSFA